MSNGTTDAGRKVEHVILALKPTLLQPFDTPPVLISELFDSHDDRDDDPEGESVEEHKSVIMHLLSQVRLGMDLTKVHATVQRALFSTLRIRDLKHYWEFNRKNYKIRIKNVSFSMFTLH